MTVETIAIILIFPMVLALNLLFIYLFTRRAVKQFVIPALTSKGYVFVSYKWVGFFACGDFKNDRMNFAFFKTGTNSISIYAYIYYKDGDSNDKRITIRIDVESLSIDKVNYSAEI